MYGDIDAIVVGAEGTGTETTDITIADNVFRQVGYAVEIGLHGNGNAVRRVSFVGNDVRGAWTGVTAGFSATGGDAFGYRERHRGPRHRQQRHRRRALLTRSALGPGNAEPPAIADHNIVQRVSIVNNLLLGRPDGPGGEGKAINLGAFDPHTTNGHIYGVDIINNTIAGFQATCCALYAKADPSTGSSIEDVIAPEHDPVEQSLGRVVDFGSARSRSLRLRSRKDVYDPERTARARYTSDGPCQHPC